MTIIAILAIVFGSIAAYVIGVIITHAYLSNRKELCKKWALDLYVASVLWICMLILVVAYTVGIKPLKALHRCALGWFEEKPVIPKAKAKERTRRE